MPDCCLQAKIGEFDHLSENVQEDIVNQMSNWLIASDIRVLDKIWYCIMHRMKIITLFLVAFCLIGCVSNADQVLPLSPSDMAELSKPAQLSWTPQIKKQIGNKPVTVKFVLFDGTGNDRLHVPSGEQQTIEGHLYDELERYYRKDVRYYPGPGTEACYIERKFDQIFGLTTKDNAEKAAALLVGEIEDDWNRRGVTEVRIFVSGFSRGAASARHFMNIFDQIWKQRHPGEEIPRFYAFLFDTVSTGQTKNLILSIPINADIVYNFVSEDERRILFPLVLDKTDQYDSDRIVTVKWPGVHSDIGMSYLSGVGNDYLGRVDALLSGMGLLPSHCYSSVADARSQGKNDSRWLLEHIIGIMAVDTPGIKISRRIFLVKDQALTYIERKNWQERMQKMQFYNNLSLPVCYSESYVGMLYFNVVVENHAIRVISLPPYIVLQPHIAQESSGNYLIYYATPLVRSRVYVSNKIIRKIIRNKNIKLDLGIVDGGGGQFHFWWFVDGERIEEIGGIFYRARDKSEP